MTVTSQHAKDVVRKFFKHSVHPTSGPFLQWLDQHGYIIVPKASARRGNEIGVEKDRLKPDVVIGKSHTASLVGGGR